MDQIICPVVTKLIPVQFTTWERWIEHNVENVKNHVHYRFWLVLQSTIWYGPTHWNWIDYVVVSEKSEEGSFSNPS